MVTIFLKRVIPGGVSIGSVSGGDISETFQYLLLKTTIDHVGSCVFTNCSNKSVCDAVDDSEGRSDTTERKITYRPRNVHELFELF